MVGLEISKMSELIRLIRSEERPILIDFYTVWCAPCKLMELVLEEVKEKYGDKVLIIRIDCEKALEIAREFSIMSVPTLMIFHRKELVEQLIGFSSRIRERIFSILDKLVKG